MFASNSTTCFPSGQIALLKSPFQPPSTGRIVQILILLAVGAVLVGYAVSDDPLYGGEPGFGAAQGLIATAGAVIAACVLLPRQHAASALTLIVTALVMLFFMEIAGEVLLGPRHRPIFQFDAKLIFRFIPNRRSTMTHAAVNGGGTVTHRINSNGFRGDEFRLPGEMPRVVVYGDSFIHAIYSADDDTFVKQLGNALSSHLNKPVETINAGVSSYGPDQIALKMEDELGFLRPNFVVVAIFAGNDYGDLMRNKLFRLGADGKLLENRWVLDSKVRMLLEISQKESILKRTIRSFVHPRGLSATEFESLMNTKQLLAEANREFRSLVTDRNYVVTNTHTDFYSADVSLTPDSESARYKVMLMNAVLGRVHQVAKRNGVPLAFLFIPHPADVSDSDEWGMSDRKSYPNYDGRNLTAPLEVTARNLGVPFLNLFDLFFFHGAADLYLRGGDDHWNAAGQKLAAEALAEVLISNGFARLPARN